jgi:hypothetical protein
LNNNFFPDPETNKKLLFKEWSEQGKNPHEEYKKLEATNHTDVIGEVISRPALPDMGSVRTSSLVLRVVSEGIRVIHQ